MRRVMTHLIAATAIWLGGCAEHAVQEAGEGGDPAVLLQGIEIQRTGRNRADLRAAQDLAMADAVAYVTDRGVARERIELITIQTMGGVSRSGSSQGGVRLAPFRYTVWLQIEGCETNVKFRTGASGRIHVPRDRSDCLAGDDKPVE